MPHKVRIKRLRDYLAFAAQKGWTVGGVERLTKFKIWRYTMLAPPGVFEDPVFDYSDANLLARLVGLRLKREAVMRWPF